MPGVTGGGGRELSGHVVVQNMLRRIRQRAVTRHRTLARTVSELGIWKSAGSSHPLRGIEGEDMKATRRIDGHVAPGSEEVRAEFERNFAERGEIGAAVAAYWRGERVVDLWGGRRTSDGDEPWNEDTKVISPDRQEVVDTLVAKIAALSAYLEAALKKAGERGVDVEAPFE